MKFTTQVLCVYYVDSRRNFLNSGIIHRYLCREVLAKLHLQEFFWITSGNFVINQSSEWLTLLYMYSSTYAACKETRDGLFGTHAGTNPCRLHVHEILKQFVNSTFRTDPENWPVKDLSCFETNILKRPLFNWPVY